MPTEARAILSDKNYLADRYNACVEVKASKSHHNMLLYVLWNPSQGNRASVTEFKSSWDDWDCFSAVSDSVTQHGSTEVKVPEGC